MARAVLNGTVVAESDHTVVLEGNEYFPPDAVKREYLTDSALTTLCPWKGTASYYHLDLGGGPVEDAAWYYPAPSEAADVIKDHVAFGRRVSVES